VLAPQTSVLILGLSVADGIKVFFPVQKTAETIMIAASIYQDAMEKDVPVGIWKNLKPVALIPLGKANGESVSLNIGLSNSYS